MGFVPPVHLMHSRRRHSSSSYSSFTPRDTLLEEFIEDFENNPNVTISYQNVKDLDEFKKAFYDGDKNKKIIGTYRNQELFNIVSYKSAYDIWYHEYEMHIDDGGHDKTETIQGHHMDEIYDMLEDRMERIDRDIKWNQLLSARDKMDAEDKSEEKQDQKGDMGE